jgi:hypothetical protein
VLAIFKDCLDPDKRPQNGVNMFSRRSKQKPAIVYISGPKVVGHYHQIIYLLGQLKVVHKQKRVFLMPDGAFDYKDRKWASNNASLFALYYLGISLSFMFTFDDQLSSEMLKDVQPSFYPPKEE